MKTETFPVGTPIRVRLGTAKKQAAYRIGLSGDSPDKGKVLALLQDGSSLGDRQMKALFVPPSTCQRIVPLEWDVYTPKSLLRVVVNAPGVVQDRPGYVMVVIGAAYELVKSGFATLDDALAYAPELVRIALDEHLNTLRPYDWRPRGSCLELAYGDGFIALAVDQQPPYSVRGMGGGWYTEIPKNISLQSAQRMALLVADRVVQDVIAQMPTWTANWWITRYKSFSSRNKK